MGDQIGIARIVRTESWLLQTRLKRQETKYILLLHCEFNAQKAKSGKEVSFTHQCESQLIPDLEVCYSDVLPVPCR